MAKITMDAQSTPAAPSAGQGHAFFDTSNKQWFQRNEVGMLGDWSKATVAQIASHSADTYYLGLQLPSFGMQAGMVFMWEWLSTKGGGTAAPTYIIRVGANGNITDTARLTLTGPAQTAVADTGFFKVMVTVRTVGAAGVIFGVEWLQHNLAATGFASTGPAGFQAVQGASAGFDNSALGGQFVGLSVNPGASGAWVTEQVFARAWY